MSRLSDVGRMASAIAHELNQPLTAILNYVQAARRLLVSKGIPMPPKAMDAMDKAVGQASRAKRHRANLRISSRRAIRAPHRGSQQRWSGEGHHAGPLVGVKGSRTISVRLSFPANPDGVHRQVQISQVVFNLVRNNIGGPGRGRAATRPSGPTASTAAGEDGARAESWSRTARPSLRRKFKRSCFSRSNHGEKGVMGLGLSIADLSSTRCCSVPTAGDAEPDRGVAFRFTLPLADQDGIGCLKTMSLSCCRRRQGRLRDSLALLPESPPGRVG